MHGPRRHGQSVRGRERRLGGVEEFQEPVLGEERRIRLDLERADAGGEAGDAGYGRRGQRLHQGVHPHPQGQVQLHRAVLDQYVVVAAAAVRDVVAPVQDAAVDDVRAPLPGDRDRCEADRVAGP